MLLQEQMVDLWKCLPRVLSQVRTTMNTHQVQCPLSNELWCLQVVKAIGLMLLPCMEHILEVRETHRDIQVAKAQSKLNAVATMVTLFVVSWAIRNSSDCMSTVEEADKLSTLLLEVRTPMPKLPKTNRKPLGHLSHKHNCVTGTAMQQLSCCGTSRGF